MPETPFNPDQPVNPFEFEMKQLGFNEVFDLEAIKKDFNRMRPQFKRLGFHDVFDKANLLKQFSKLKFPIQKIESKDLIESDKVISVIKKSADMYQTSYKRAMTVVRDAENKYRNETSTKERKRYRELKKEQDNSKKRILDIAKRERKSILNLKDEDKKRLELEKQRLKVKQDLFQIEKLGKPQLEKAEKAAIRSEGRIPGAMGIAGKAGDVLKKIGGPMSKLGGVIGMVASKLGILGGVAGVLVAVLNKLVGANKEYTKIQAKLRQTGSETLRDITDKGVQAFSKEAKGAFGGESFINLEKATELINILSDAPKALENIVTPEGIAKTAKLTKIMGYFGISAEQTAKIMADSSKKMGFGVEDLTDTFKTAKSIADSTNLTFSDAFHSLLGLNEELRNFSMNTVEASKALFAATIPLEKMGFEQEDIKKFTANLGKMMSSLTASKLMGFTAFTTGRMAGTAELEHMAGFKRDEEGKLIKDESGQGAKDALAATLDFLSQSMENINPERQLVALEKLAPMAGFSAGLKDLVGLKEILKSWTEQGADINKLLAAAKEKERISPAEMEALQKKGFETLVNLKSPVELLGTVLGNLTEDGLKPLIKAVKTLNRILSGGSIKDIFFGGGIPQGDHNPQGLTLVSSGKDINIKKDVRNNKIGSK